MENINAEVITLRNQRKQIKNLIGKLNILIGQFDKIENTLLKSQYKHGLMFAIDEITYDKNGFDKNIFLERLEELFIIKQKYHHLWAESQDLYNTMQNHYTNEAGLFQSLIKKIENFTPENIEEIRSIQQKKKVKQKLIFKDITNIKKEIDDLMSVSQDLTSMEEYVLGKSPKAYYQKNVKNFNSIIDKIAAEKKKLEQYKKVNNANMIKSTKTVIQVLEKEKEVVIEKTILAIRETKKSLENKISKRKKIADKFLKIKTIRIFIQGLPWAGKFSFIHLLDIYSSQQRKGNFMLINAPDYIVNEFKGLLVWVHSEDQNLIEGEIITLPDFERNFDEYKERVKVKIELTCGTGYGDNQIFPPIIGGMKFEGLIFLYDSSNNQNLEEAKKLLNLTKKTCCVDGEIPTLIFANKNDLFNPKQKELIDELIDGNKSISILKKPDEVHDIFLEFLNNLIMKHSKIKEILDINI